MNDKSPPYTKTMEKEKFSIARLLTSLSDRYMRSQFENIRSTDSSDILRSGDVTSAHINLTFL